jgi:hypothetical protein
VSPQARAPSYERAGPALADVPAGVMCAVVEALDDRSMVGVDGPITRITGGRGGTPRVVTGCRYRTVSYDVFASYSAMASSGTWAMPSTMT